MIEKILIYIPKIIEHTISEEIPFEHDITIDDLTDTCNIFNTRNIRQKNHSKMENNFMVSVINSFDSTN